MAFLEFLTIFMLLFILVSFSIMIYIHQNTKTGVPINWPILGMLPRVLVNSHRLHDFAAEVLTCSGGTFMFKGPWFANMNMLLTTDPLDIHHILSKNFNNYPKGDKFRKIFDALGDGILNSDGKIWEINRKVAMSVLKHGGFQITLETIIWNKVEKELLPLLDSTCRHGKEIDLQELFHRFTFDTICKLLLDNDPKSLSLDFPIIPMLKAFEDGEEALLFRHVTPPIFWKMQQLLRVGKEKKLSDACSTFDQFIYKCLDQKEEYKNMNHEEENFIFFKVVMKEFNDLSDTSLDCTKFLRDTLLNLMIAGKDSTSNALSWFFYSIATNPRVEDKILEDMHTHLNVKRSKRWNMKDLDEMVYLHGALCESLRLFPPDPFNHKSPLESEILPSGHKVDKNTTIILSFYSMGRMESIWGEDCMEFKPERWISNNGRNKHVPSYKFATFNAGPRTCVGKNMAFTQLKIVSTAILYHYHVEMVEGHCVLPADTIVLQMKHGLEVKLTKRSELN